jgi:hypothetical protein
MPGQGKDLTRSKRLSLFGRRPDKPTDSKPASKSSSEQYTQGKPARPDLNKIGERRSNWGDK